MIVSRAEEYVLSHPGGGQSVEIGPPVLVRLAVCDRVRPAPAVFPRLGFGGSPSVGIAAQFGDMSDSFFRIRHRKDCSLS